MALRASLCITDAAWAGSCVEKMTGVCELLQPVAPLEAARDAAAFPRRAARVDLLRVAVGAAVHFTAACTRGGERAMPGGVKRNGQRGLGGVEI